MNREQEKMNIPIKLYTTEEVSAILRCHIDTIRRYIREGKFKDYIMSGKQYLIPYESLEKYLDQNCPNKFAERSIKGE